MKRVRNYKLNQQLCIVVNVFKDRTQSSWIKERAPTKHPKVLSLSYGINM